MDLELTGRVVLVTGGAMARSSPLPPLVGEGTSVALCGRSTERLKAAEQLISAHAAESADVLAIECDVRDPDQLASMVDDVGRHFGRLDGLVNNAGRSAAATVAATTDEDWLKTWISSSWPRCA